MVIFRRIINDATFLLLALLDQRKFFFGVNGFSDEPSGVCLNEHKFQNINLFVSHPCVVEILQVLAHVL